MRQEKQNRWLLGLLLAISVLLLVLTGAGLVSAYTTDAKLDHAAGVWITLAVDLADGTFYRPLVSDIGYGGTRLMPLHFVIHAALIKVFQDPVLSGYVLTGFAAIGLFSGLVFLLSGWGASPLYRLICAALVCASLSSQYAFGTIHGDLLPAALNVWGLAFCIGRSRESNQKEILAGLFFALAWMAKFTTVFGFAAAWLYLMLNRKTRAAWRMVGVFIAAIGVFGLVVHVTSGGRAFETIVACSSGGGSLADILNAPIHFWRSLKILDPYGLLCLVAAAAVFLSSLSFRNELSMLVFIATFVVTLVIFGSPGTDINHLLDLHIFGIIILVRHMQLKPKLRSFIASYLVVVGILACLHIVKYGGIFSKPELDRSRLHAEVLEAVGGSQHLLLTENPLVAVRAGQSPFILDPFMFRVITQRNSELAEPLWKLLDQKAFFAVILIADVEAKSNRDWYTNFNFGPDFRERLLLNYFKADEVGNLVIYKPRQETV